jgi:hypothetical protein
VTLLDPFSLAATSYTPTPFRTEFSSRNTNGIGLCHGDFDGDRRVDLAAVNDDGEVLLYLGHGDGTFTSSGRSFGFPVGPTVFLEPVQAIDAGDFNHDGLAEIVVGDMSGPPYNLVFELNASR